MRIERAPAGVAGAHTFSRMSLSLLAAVRNATAWFPRADDQNTAHNPQPYTQSDGCHDGAHAGTHASGFIRKARTDWTLGAQIPLRTHRSPWSSMPLLGSQIALWTHRSL